MTFQGTALLEATQPPIKVYKIDRTKVNNRIAIDYIRHRVRLVMAENAIIADLLRLLDKAILDIRRDLATTKNIAFAEAINIANRSGFGVTTLRTKVVELKEASPDPILPAVAKTAAEQITRRINSKLQGPVAQLHSVLRQSLVKVADAEQQVFSTLINKQIPKSVRDSLGGIAVGRDLPFTQLQQLVDEPLGGEQYATRLQATYGRSLQRVRASLFQGLVNGEDNKTISRRVEGVISSNLRRNAATLARTEVHRVANSVQAEMYAVNDDIIDQLQFVATLDDRTCIFCGNLDGQTYDIGEEPQIPGDTHPNCRCLLDPRTPIYTSKGWIRVRDIKVGDLVLTHKGRFKSVIVVHEPVPFEGVAIKISLKIDNTVRSILVTPDHPFYANDRWVRADCVSVGMMIGIATKPCIGCGEYKPLVTNCIATKNRYCSIKCAARVFTAKDSYKANMSALMTKRWTNSRYKRRMIVKMNAPETKALRSAISRKMWREPEFRRKRKLWENRTVKYRSALTVAQWKDPVVRAKMSEAISKGNIMSFQNGNRDRYKTTEKARAALVRKYGSLSKMFSARVRHKGMRSLRRQTWIEKRMGWLLTELGMPCAYNMPIKSGVKKSNRQPEYIYPDFTVLGTKILIECDGSYWHKNANKDDARQKFLEREGYTVLRFSDRDIKYNLVDCGLEVLRVLANHKHEYSVMQVPVHSVKHVRVGVRDELGRIVRAPKKRYNFSVKDDESFVAKGFVVHNCVMVPVLKSWRALGIDADDVPDTVRASMDGTVPARMTFEDFFDDQDEEFKKAVLGPSRYELYKQGDLEFSQFSTSTRIRPIKNLIRMAGGVDELDMTNIKTVIRRAAPALPVGGIGYGGDITLPGQLALPAVPEATVPGLKQSFVPGTEHPLVGLKASSGAQVESAFSDIIVQRVYEFGKSDSARKFTAEFKDSVSWMFGKDKAAIAKEALGMLGNNSVGVANWSGKIALHPTYIDALRPLFNEKELNAWLAKNIRVPVPPSIGLRGKRLMYLSHGGNPAAPKALQVLTHETTHFVSRVVGENKIYQKTAYRVLQEALTDSISISEYKETARRLFGFSSAEAQAIPNVTSYYRGWVNSLQSLTDAMPKNVRNDWIYRLKYQTPLSGRLDKLAEWINQGRVERGLASFSKAQLNTVANRLEIALEAVGREGPFHRIDLAAAVRGDLPKSIRFVGVTATPPYTGAGSLTPAVGPSAEVLQALEAPDIGKTSLGKTAKSWAAKLSEREIGALKNYADNSFQLNSTLRQRAYLSADPLPVGVKDMDDIISKYKLPVDTTVYRGITGKKEWIDGIVKGGRLFDQGYVSTSRSFDVANDFAQGVRVGDDVAAVVRVKVPKGYNAAPLEAAIESWAEQQELVLKRETYLIVDKVSKVKVGGQDLLMIDARVRP